MGLFGRRKTYGELALEEAQRREASVEGSVHGSAEISAGIAPWSTSARTFRRKKRDRSARALKLVARALSGRRRPDTELLAALDELRRRYAGRALDDARPAIAAMLEDRGHVVPDSFLDLVAEAVTGVHE